MTDIPSMWGYSETKIKSPLNLLFDKASMWSSLDALLQENICWWNVRGWSLWTSPSGDISRLNAGQCFLQPLNHFSGSFLLPSPTSSIIFWKTPKLTAVTQHVPITDIGKIISLSSHGICYFLPEQHSWSLGWACMLWLYSPSVKSLLSYCLSYCSACLPPSSLWNKSKISKLSGDAWHSFLKQRFIIQAESCSPVAPAAFMAGFPVG